MSTSQLPRFGKLACPAEQRRYDTAFARLRLAAKRSCPAWIWVPTRVAYGTLLVWLAFIWSSSCAMGRWMKNWYYGIDPRNPRRRVNTLEEVDRIFARAVEAAEISDDAFRRVLDEFCYNPDIALPADPDSPEYRRAQLDLYCRISGRAGYTPHETEVLSVDVRALLECPYPYWTHSSRIVGEHLMGIGFLLRALDLRPGDRILEFGPGSGTSTLEFARMGHPVTAVDINPGYIEVIRGRSRQAGLRIELACAEMLDYQPDEPFDRVVFYECFHHCADHLEMIERFDLLVRPGGAVFFAGEPIHDFLPWPWGLRMDGQAIWAIRKHGWLELGFRPDYFVRTLARFGWTTTEVVSKDVAWQQVFVARRTSEIRD